MTNLKGLDVLDELSISVPTRVDTFTIHPVNMKNIKRFSILSVPLYTDLMAVFDNQGDIVNLIEQHEVAAIELLSLCSDFTQEHYNDDNFYPDDFTALIIGLVEVNMDFFVQKLLPKVTQQGSSMVARLNQVMSKIGQTQSSVLSAMGTVTKAS